MNEDINDTFSIRNGFKPPQLLQLKELDPKTRTAIYNEICMWRVNTHKESYWDKIQAVDMIYWMKWLDKPITDFEHLDHDKSTIQKYKEGFFYTFHDIKESIMYSTYSTRFALQINEVFDLIEFLIKAFLKVFSINLSSENDDIVHKLIESLNQIFEDYKVGYLITRKTGIVIKTTNKEELKSIDDAASTPFDKANELFIEAIKSYRENKYSNTVAHSVNALESILKNIHNQKSSTLGDIIKTLITKEGIKNKELIETIREQSQNTLEQSKYMIQASNILRLQACSKLYGYASNNSNRHGQTEDKIAPTESQARFILITCSAMINYFIKEYNDNNQE